MGNEHPPTARLVAAPPYIPIGDDFHTDVTLDGAGSRSEIDDPGGTLPLAFRFDIDDEGARVVGGSLTSAAVTVRLAGARPTAARLTVTDTRGNSAVATVEIGLTLPADM